MNTAPKFTTRTLLAPLALGLIIPLCVTSCQGCKKDEPPPPLPSAAPVATPSAPLELVAEDAGEDVVDAAPEADAKKTGGRPAGSLTACCAALNQNAASAPEPTATYMRSAAATCSALAAQGKDKSSAGGILSGMLRGAGMPAACR